MGDGLGGVDGAAAADADDQVRTEDQRLGDALFGVGHGGIGLGAAEFTEGHARFGKRGLHAAQQAAAHHAALAVDQQGL